MSQLELYLDGLENSDSSAISAEYTDSKDGNEGYQRYLMHYLQAPVTEICSGWSKDFQRTYGWMSLDESTSIVPIELPDLLRWLSLGYCALKSSWMFLWRTRASTHVLLSIVHFVNGYISLLLVITLLSPFLCGWTLAYLVSDLQRQVKTCEVQFGSLLGIVKRVQIVALGYSISHPLPPIHKIESTMEKSQGKSSKQFVCTEVRRALKVAITELLQGLKGSVDSDPDITISGTSTTGHLQELSELAFHRCRAATLTSFQSTLHKLADVTSGNSPWMLLHSILTTPLRIANLTLLLLKFQSRMVAISRSVQSTADTTSPPSIASDSCCDEYLKVRMRLARLRSRYEEVSLRLWLSESALCRGGDASQLLFPPPADSHAGSTRSDLRALSESLGKLHGVDDVSAVDREEELKDNLDCLLRSLPGVDDLLAVDEALRCLIKVRQGRPMVRRADDKTAGLAPTGHVHDQPPSLPVTWNARDHQQPSAYGEEEEEEVVVPLLASESLSANSTGLNDDSKLHTVEVFAAVVTRQTRRVETDADEHAARQSLMEAERDLLQAKSMMRELNTHLQRKESSTVRVEKVRTLTAAASIDTTTNVIEPGSRREPDIIEMEQTSKEARVDMKPSGIALSNLAGLLASSQLKMQQETFFGSDDESE